MAAAADIQAPGLTSAISVPALTQTTLPAPAAPAPASATSVAPPAPVAPTVLTAKPPLAKPVAP